jgi:hypothetical protein
MSVRYDLKTIAVRDSGRIHDASVAQHRQRQLSMACLVICSLLDLGVLALAFQELARAEPCSPSLHN